MKIGIDISQIVYEGTGVSVYVKQLVTALLERDQINQYVLFGASVRKLHILKSFAKTLKAKHHNITCVFVPISPTVLDLVWNRFHILPVMWFTGPLDVFWSSDWTQPPLGKRVRGITTIHDVSFLRFPESFPSKILSVQKRRLDWAKRECQHFLCDSKATKADVEKILKIDSTRLSVVYPGYSPTLTS